MATEVTGTSNEDGTLTVKDTEGKEVRYAKESDLLAVKGSRDDLQKKVEAADAAKGTKSPETIVAEKAADEAKNAQVKAEAETERLTEEIKIHTGTTEELEKLKTELKTAEEAGKSSATALLELRRTFIIGTYKVPPETVNEKDLKQLELFEEALKAVIGGAGTGNYAIGGGGGGAGSLEGKSPMELAQMAYVEKK